MLTTIVGSIVGWELLKWLRRRRKRTQALIAQGQDAKKQLR